MLLLSFPALRVRFLGFLHFLRFARVVDTASGLLAHVRFFLCVKFRKVLVYFIGVCLNGHVCAQQTMTSLYEHFGAHTIVFEREMYVK